jgi:antitoxin ParD1/3/4
MPSSTIAPQNRDVSAGDLVAGTLPTPANMTASPGAIAQLAIFANVVIIAFRSAKTLMPTRNVNLTDELDSFVLAKVGSGRYENASEVVRAALRTLEREERRYEAKLAALQTAIDAGAHSGIAEGDSFDRVRRVLKLSAKPLNMELSYARNSAPAATANFLKRAQIYGAIARERGKFLVTN